VQVNEPTDDEFIDMNEVEEDDEDYYTDNIITEMPNNKPLASRLESSRIYSNGELYQL
jgi:hypothetical protein